ncbi:hypothetical protein HDU67_002490 [Dinochytrium kinnereticum]|nr:hypothetical protein HDU67_002490 [Dinochytrium kinnereticum]
MHSQKRGMRAPVYTEYSRGGMDHMPRFIYQVLFENAVYVGHLECSTVKAAKAEAARVALSSLKDSMALQHVSVVLLQEHCIRHTIPPPTYQESGPQTHPTTKFSVTVDGRSFEGQVGRTPQEARSSAAAAALRHYYSVDGEVQRKRSGSEAFGALSLNSPSPSERRASILRNTVQDPLAVARITNASESVETGGMLGLFGPEHLKELNELAQKRKAIIRDVFEENGMGMFACHFTWNGVVLPKSDFYPKKKLAKAHAAALSLMTLRSNHSYVEERQHKAFFIKEKDNLETLPVEVKVKPRELGNTPPEVLEEETRAFASSLAPSNEMLKATKELLSHISSLLDIKEAAFEKIVLSGAFGRQSSLIYDYNLEVILVSSEKLSRDTMTLIRTELGNNLGSQATVSEVPFKPFQLEVLYIGIQKITFRVHVQYTPPTPALDSPPAAKIGEPDTCEADEYIIDFLKKTPEALIVNRLLRSWLSSSFLSWSNLKDTTIFEILGAVVHRELNRDKAPTSIIHILYIILEFIRGWRNITMQLDSEKGIIIAGNADILQPLLNPSNTFLKRVCNVSERHWAEIGRFADMTINDLKKIQEGSSTFTYMQTLLQPKIDEKLTVRGFTKLAGVMVSKEHFPYTIPYIDCDDEHTDRTVETGKKIAMMIFSQLSYKGFFFFREVGETPSRQQVMDMVDRCVTDVLLGIIENCPPPPAKPDARCFRFLFPLRSNYTVNVTFRLEL